MTTILSKARSLRRLISPDAEYAIRRALNTVIPVRARSENGNVYHVCVWKTASQWVRLVLSDPRIYRYSGLSVCLPNPLLRPDPRTVRLPERTIVAALVRDYPFFAALPKPERHFAFFVKRDPRDLIVSFYFSNRYSHPLDPVIARERATLARMSESEGLEYTIDQFGQFVAILRSWEEAARHDPRVVVVRYEDLTGIRQLDAWQALLDAADIRMPRQVLAEVLATYSFAKITGGRNPGTEAVAHKYRKGIAGDWKNHLTAAMLAAFHARYGSLCADLGYDD
ncbi:MAG: sulfotransferase domain-containing protein [Rhodospirillales bacterium]